jgi:hypothetical protein
MEIIDGRCEKFEVKILAGRSKLKEERAFFYMVWSPFQARICSYFSGRTLFRSNPLMKIR